MEPYYASKPWQCLIADNSLLKFADCVAPIVLGLACIFYLQIFSILGVLITVLCFVFSFVLLFKLDHSWEMWGSRLMLTHDAVRVCRRCGAVQEGWYAFAGIDGYLEHFSTTGYVNIDDPAVTRMFGRSQLEVPP